MSNFIARQLEAERELVSSYSIMMMPVQLSEWLGAEG